MRHEREKVLRFWILVFAGFALFAIAAVSPKYAENLKLQRAVARSEKEIEMLREEFVRLEAVEEALKNDPFFTELMARRELRMAKPGEEEVPVKNRLRKKPPASSPPNETSFEFYMMFLARHRTLQYFLMAVAFSMICAALLLFGGSEKPLGSPPAS